MRFGFAVLLLLLTCLDTLLMGTTGTRLPLNNDPLELFVRSPHYESVVELADRLGAVHRLVPWIDMAMPGASQNREHRFVVKQLNAVNPLIGQFFSRYLEGIDAAQSSLPESVGKIKQYLIQASDGASRMRGKPGSQSAAFENNMRSFQQGLQDCLDIADTLESIPFAKSESRPIDEDFIIHEYIPTGQRIHVLKMRLSGRYSMGVDGIKEAVSAWQAAHEDIAKSAAKMHGLIAAVRRGVKQMPSDVWDKLQSFTDGVLPLERLSNRQKHLDGILQSLDRNDQSLETIDGVARSRADEMAELPVAIPQIFKMTRQIEAIVPRLTELHDELHSVHPRIRFLQSELKKIGTVKNTQENIQQNNIIRKQLNRLRHDVDSAMDVLRSHGLACLTKNKSNPTFPTVDLMQPLERFLEVDLELKRSRNSKRFRVELESIREQLRQMHLFAHRLYHVASR